MTVTVKEVGLEGEVGQACLVPIELEMMSVTLLK